MVVFVVFVFGYNLLEDVACYRSMTGNAAARRSSGSQLILPQKAVFSLDAGCGEKTAAAERKELHWK